MGPWLLLCQSVQCTHVQPQRHVYRRGCQPCRASRASRCSAGKGFGAAPVSQEPLVVEKKAKSGKELKKLGKWIHEELSSVSIAIVGDDAAFNENLGAAISPVLEYAPLCTSQMLEELTGSTVQAIVGDEGPDSLGAAEAAVVESLSTYVRCCIATCGGGIGAAARSACWRHLHGAVTIWLDTQGSGEKESPQNEAYGLADLHVKVNVSEDDDSNTIELAKATMKEVLPALETLLEKDKELCKKKSLYVRLGCRGDWPNLKPPEWNPDSVLQS